MVVRRLSALRIFQINRVYPNHFFDQIDLREKHGMLLLNLKQRLSTRAASSVTPISGNETVEIYPTLVVHWWKCHAEVVLFFCMRRLPFSPFVVITVLDGTANGIDGAHLER